VLCLLLQLSKDLDLFSAELQAVVQPSSPHKHSQQASEQGVKAGSQQLCQVEQDVSESDNFLRALQQ
jgi:hypothetical protein